MVKHQRTFMVLKATSNVKGLLKSGAVPLYCSLVTSLPYHNMYVCTSCWYGLVKPTASYMLMIAVLHCAL